MSGDLGRITVNPEAFGRMSRLVDAMKRADAAGTMLLPTDVARAFRELCGESGDERQQFLDLRGPVLDVKDVIADLAKPKLAGFLIRTIGPNGARYSKLHDTALPLDLKASGAKTWALDEAAMILPLEALVEMQERTERAAASTLDASGD